MELQQTTANLIAMGNLGTIEAAVDFVRPWLQQYGLWPLALGLFAETFLFTGFVIPGFALLLTSGYLVADGTFAPLPTLLAAWGGAVCGDQGGYWIGYKWGNQLLAKRGELVKHLRQMLEREGPWLLVFYHDVPAFRTVFPAVVGSSCFNLRRWVFFDTLGVLIWVTASLALGYTAHDALVSGNTLYRIADAVAFLLLLVITWRIYRALSQREPTKHEGSGA
ncbi:MAG: DedA family protein [Armatimonadota bacterium]